MKPTKPVADVAELADDWMNDDRHLGINWVARGCGFGMLTFAQRGDGTFVCDNECMSRRFLLDRAGKADRGDER